MEEKHKTVRLEINGVLLLVTPGGDSHLGLSLISSCPCKDSIISRASLSSLLLVIFSKNFIGKDRIGVLSKLSIKLRISEKMYPLKAVENIFHDFQPRV